MSDITSTADDPQTAATQRPRAESFNLLGKDYLTQAEAAHYCGLSLRQFQLVAPGAGIPAGRFGGKLLYRRADLQRAIETEWHRYDQLRAPGSSTGAKTAAATASRSAASTRSQSATPAGS